MTHRSTLLHRGFLPLALVILGGTSACGGSSPAPAAAHASTSESAVSGTSTSAAAPVSLAAVKAAGGGNFCKLVASAADRAAVAGTSADDIAARIALVRKEEAAALLLAPSAIKADVTLLYTAADKVWAALESVHYDYSKLDASNMTALSTPGVVAAEKRLAAYMSGTCGLTMGASTSPASK